MRILTAALPLAGSFARARVGLKQAIRAVTSSHGTASGDRLFVSPEGPLNILRGHLAVNNDVIAKKRLFSPPIHIYYALEEIKKNETDQTEESGTVSEQHMVSTPMHTNYALEETRKHKTDPAVKPDADSEEHSLSPPPDADSEQHRVYKYDRDPKQDEVWNCTGSEEVDAYLRAYYSTLKVLFRTANSKVVVSTSHHLSFYKYTRVQFSDAERARFFAALLLLANGERRISTEYRGRATGSKAHPLQEIFGVALKSGKSTLVDLNFTIPNTLPSKKATLYVEEVRTVVSFFVAHGAADVEEYELDYTDSPGFLMQAYLCEYASDDAFIGEVFRCVEAFLAEMYSGAELVTARGRYFTADEKGVGEYSEQYDMLTRIYEINSRSRFPFTSSNMPPGTHYVHYYDEKAGLPCDAVSYSDCGEIALYNFFCCVLYDPVARSYSTKHLEEKNCAPTVRFKHFFTEVCTAPGDNTKACIHQEWARVAQGLVLPPAADNKAEVAGAQTTRSLIKYSKSVTDAVSVALKADIGTFLMALAEIAGLPAAVKKDLADTVGELLAFPPGNVDCAKLAQLFNEVVNTRISTRAAKVDLYNVKVGVDKEEEKILSGSIVLSFPPQEDGQPCYEIKLEFSFDPRHVDTFYKPNDVTLDNDDRKFFAVRDRTMGDRNGPLSGLIRDCVKRFLSKADGTLLPSDHIAGVESAHDPKALYTALSRWLCYTPMYSEPDRLAAIDQLFPAFMRLLKQRRTILSASNPLVLLIANILGSVALNDAETRDCFLRAVFTHCTGDREELFPGIRIQPPLYHTEPDACAVCPSELGFWRLSGFRVPNIALEYLRQVAVACSAQSSVVPEEASIVKLLEQLYDTRGYGYRVVNMFMTYRCVEAVELLRGYCMLDMPDEDDGVWRWMVRRVFWFCLALENRIYSEVRWACGVWDERKFTKFREILADRDLDTPGELPPLSEHIVAKVFPDGPSSAQLVILLGLYAQLALFKADYGEIVYRALENNTLQAAPRFVIVDICQASVFAFLGHCCTYSRTQSKGGTRANLMLLKSDLEDLKSFVNKIEQFYQAKEKLPDKLNRVLRDCRLKLADSDTELQKVPEMPALPQ